MYGMKIGRPREEDTLKIHEFFDTVIRSTFGNNNLGGMRESLQEEKTYKRSCLRQDFDSEGQERYFLIAKLDETIIGTIEYGSSNEIVKNVDEALIHIKEVGTVYVHPDYQRQGVGRKLLDAIGQSLIDRGFDQCIMDSGYPSAQAIWMKKFGPPYHLLKDYWGQGDDHMIWLLKASQLISLEVHEDNLRLTMAVIETDLSVCKLALEDKIPRWALASDWFSITKTRDELSIVCESRLVPKTSKAESGWRGLKVAGPLGFEMLGILSKLSKALAKAGVSIFAISTYNTDYILVKEDKLNAAIRALAVAGIKIEGENE